MLNSKIDYDTDVVAENEALEAQEAWELSQLMDDEPVQATVATEPIGDLNRYGDTMCF